MDKKLFWKGSLVVIVVMVCFGFFAFFRQRKLTNFNSNNNSQIQRVMES